MADQADSPPLSFTVTLNDGSAFDTPDVIAGDMVRFERQYGDLDVLNKKRVEGTLYLAWLSLRRGGQAVPDDFEAFIDAVKDIKDNSENGSPKAPTPDSSQPSPSEQASPEAS